VSPATYMYILYIINCTVNYIFVHGENVEVCYTEYIVHVWTKIKGLAVHSTMYMTAESNQWIPWCPAPVSFTVIKFNLKTITNRRILQNNNTWCSLNNQLKENKGLCRS
jgi:hypothetical protein